MKTSTNILKCGLIAFALLIISCDKQETETDISKEAVIEEGFMSTTEHSDSEIEESQEGLYPLLHISFDASLSEEEADAKFQTEISKLEKEVDQTTNKGGRSVFYSIRTRTGGCTNCKTDGRVEASVSFKSQEGISYSPKLYLDNHGDDRERGQWDFYIFVHKIDVWDEWIAVNRATINLQGRDGWYIKKLDVIIESINVPMFQWSVTGRSHLDSYPELWLDNKYLTSWDSFSTRWASRGRVTFEYTYPGL